MVRSMRLVFWLRIGQCWVTDPFSFHSSNETGGNQAEPVRPPTSQCCNVRCTVNKGWFVMPQWGGQFIEGFSGTVT
jgi:hypothetical protein